MLGRRNTVADGASLMFRRQVIPETPNHLLDLLEQNGGVNHAIGSLRKRQRRRGNEIAPPDQRLRFVADLNRPNLA